MGLPALFHLGPRQNQTNARVISFHSATDVSNTILFIFSNKMEVISAVFLIMLVRIANKEDLGQTASKEVRAFVVGN